MHLETRRHSEIRQRGKHRQRMETGPWCQTEATAQREDCGRPLQNFLCGGDRAVSLQVSHPNVAIWNPEALRSMLEET